MVSKSKILIVDDALFMRKTICRTLTNHDYDLIFEAANGKEGIALYQEQRPDIVLLDITMPDISGIEVLKEILKIDDNAVVIMCSAVGQEKMIANALRIGAKDFVVKPYKEEMLISVIRSLE